MRKGCVAILLVVMCFAILSPSPAKAQSCSDRTNADFFGLVPWYACLPGADQTPPQPQIRTIGDIWLILFPIIEDGIKIAGYLAGFYVLWGGVLYLKSRGIPGETMQAQTTIRNALIGLGIAVFSVAIVKFAQNSFGAANRPQTGTPPAISSMPVAERTGS